MLPDDSFLRALTREVWLDVLGLEALDSECGASDFSSSCESEKQMVASVDIAGAWDGTVSLSFSPALGLRVASAMLRCPESEIAPALVNDVVGELANIIGGNVKVRLPGLSTLSLPRVDTQVRGDDDTSHCVWFDCEGSSFRVAMRPLALPRRTQS